MNPAEVVKETLAGCKRREHNARSGKEESAEHLPLPAVGMVEFLYDYLFMGKMVVYWYEVRVERAEEEQEDQQAGKDRGQDSGRRLARNDIVDVFANSKDYAHKDYKNDNGFPRMLRRKKGPPFDLLGDLLYRGFLPGGFGVHDLLRYMGPAGLEPATN